ncbi:hypothetical protein KKG48_02320 [Patescibacteria group bacterium]|nr:hypothetical protein [Patescibacteria group bacterium]MCG2695195.1 hypothetical protein [Candidatus Parcubacteria bacterium]
MIKQNKIIYIVIIVVGFVFLGWYIQQQNKLPETTGEEEENITIQPIDSEEVTLETDEWQTYRSEKYGYEIEYPDNFVIKEYFPQKNEGGFCDVLEGTDKEFSKTKAGQGITKDKIFSFQIYTNLNPECDQRIISHYESQLTGKLLPGIYLGSEKNIINGKEFTKTSYLEVLPDLQDRIPNQVAYEFSVWELTVGGKRYVFSYYFNKNYHDNSFTENEFKKILSTFGSPQLTLQPSNL